MKEPPEGVARLRKSGSMVGRSLQIGSLFAATLLKANDAEALSYWNLLLRERAQGLRCEAVDGGEAAGGAPDGGAPDGGAHFVTCGEQKARDLAEADRLMRQAAALFRARAAAQPAAAPTPAPKGGH